MTITKAQEWTAEKVMDLTREEVLELWGQCPAADMAELVGEYTGLIPNAGDEEAQKRAAAFMFDESSIRGYWLGKAYSPLSKTRGDGYNHWRRPGGKVERNLRFATEMGTSLIDGKPSLMMYYGAYDNRARERDLVDEIRKLADGIYLGLGASKNPDGTRSEPGHFALAGPIGPWVGVDDPTLELI
jgi:hypothetical protein